MSKVNSQITFNTDRQRKNMDHLVQIQCSLRVGFVFASVISLGLDFLSN